MNLPLISCIMPTADRRAFIGKSLEYFSRQTYPNREMIVIDDGWDAVDDIVVSQPGVFYTVYSRRGMLVGEKRNLACEKARGEFIAHWDDDDWHDPMRLQTQYDTMRTSDVDVVGQDSVLYYDVENKNAWRYRYPPQRQHSPGWVAGNTFFYRREYWKSKTFQRVNIVEDNRFLWDLPLARVGVSNHDHVVGIIHAGNVSPKAPERYPQQWQPSATEEVARIVGDDIGFYKDFRR